MRETFVERAFRRSSVILIDHANKIIEDYQAQGFTLTLRQLYYQFVARGLLPNAQHEYKRLGSVINDARIAGLIDWSAIEDRVRHTRSYPQWDTAAAFMQDAPGWYGRDRWEGQRNHVEVWVEKDALVGIIEGVCQEFRVPYLACKGYNSQSEQYRAGKRFEEHFAAGRRPTVLHLGDHDPSGIDMTRDNTDRLEMFAREGVTVDRIALNWDQVEQYKPPPNPTKETDSRSTGYRARFGENSWELDALDPAVLDALLRSKIEPLIDREAWDAVEAAEDAQRKILKVAAERWGSVEKFLNRKPKTPRKKRSQGRKPV